MPMPPSSYKPQPPKMPGYARQNINPDRDQQTTGDSIASLRQEVDQLKQFIGIKYTLSNPSSNYASPLDAFYTRAGSLPSYLMNLGYLSFGPNGTLAVTNNSGIGAGGIFSITGSGPFTINWTTCVVTYQGIQYPIASGSTTSIFVIWQLSNPNIFQGHASTGLTLGIDDFLIATNNGVGQWDAAMNLVQSNGARLVLSGNSVFLYNSSGNLAGDWDVGGSNQGLLELRNSSGAVTLSLDGNTGIITSNGTAMTVP